MESEAHLAGITFYEWFWGQTLEPIDSECWEWQRGHGQAGYGRCGTLHAHRVAWTLVHGDIPDTLWVLHHCDNPPCVRPTHLFLGTAADNTLDMIQKGRHAAMNLVSCVRGHSRTIAGRVLIGPCRACATISVRSYYLRHRDRILTAAKENYRRTHEASEAAVS